MLFRVTALLLAPALIAAFAQDERRAASPNGQIEFRVWIAPQDAGGLFRLAYEVAVRGRPAIARSYLALDLLNQEPMLGEKDGLIGSHEGSGPGYRSLVAEYMQDGSLGRLINIEARVYDDGVAFRYVLPRATPQVDLSIADEATEFHFAAGKEALGGIGENGRHGLPFVAALPGGESIAILEVKSPEFPAMSLVRLNGDTLVTRLARKANDPELAFEGHTPFTGPWRVILFGAVREKILDSAWVKALKP